MSGNMHLYTRTCRTLSSKYIHAPINLLDTVQQIKQSMFWTVSLTFDLIHFVGRCPANIHLLDRILVSSKLNVSGSAKWT